MVRTDYAFTSHELRVILKALWRQTDRLLKALLLEKEKEELEKKKQDLEDKLKKNDVLLNPTITPAPSQKKYLRGI